MSRLYFICFIFLTKSLYTKSQESSNWLLNSELSFIEYEAKHPLHAWTGLNEKIKGVLVKDQNDTRIAVSANISDFDTGNSNRDSNSLRVLNAFDHPQVRFYSDRIVIEEEKISFQGEIDFHGVQIEKSVDADFKIEKNEIEIDGSFSIVITDFDIKLPSLMLVKMDDVAKINFKLIFQN